MEFVEEKIDENRRWDVKAELMRLGREVFREDYRRRSGDFQAKEELAKIVRDASVEAECRISEMQKSAQATLEVIAANNLSISDFSGGKASFANYFAKIAAGDIVEPGASVYAALNADEKWSSKTSPRRADILALAPTLRPVLQQLTDDYQRHHRFLHSVELLRRNYRNFALLTDLTAKIEDVCMSENILPIAETNNILHKLVAGNDTPFIFEKAGNHFSRFMIDEFQDTSTMQWENFLPLLQNAVSQTDSTPILLVGDIKQSIYRWRGGDWRILEREIERCFDSVQSSDLVTNRRSFENIVTFNNNIISQCTESDSRRLDTELADAEAIGLIGKDLREELSGVLARAYEGHEQRSVKGAGKGYAKVEMHEKDDDETSDIPLVISKIDDLQQRGFRPGEIAILVRTGAEGVAIANLLLKYKERNPMSPWCYDVVTQEALLINSAPVTAFILACFKLAINPGDGIQKAVYNLRLGRKPDANDTPDDRLFFEKLRLLPPQEAFEEVVRRYALGKMQSDIAYIQALGEEILAFSRTSIGDLRIFVLWWDENGGDASVNIPASDGERSAITISTIHKAKGLQYRAVILPYCNWSLAPMLRSTVWGDASVIAAGLGEFPVGFGSMMKNSLMAPAYYRELVMNHVDSINIFYVAVTRAEEELHIMIPGSRRRQGDRISTLLLDALGLTEERTAYELGTPIESDVATQHIDNKRIYGHFESYDISDRLRLRMRSERYADDPNGALSPRNYGILMHRVFEQADDLHDIERTLGDMTAAGQLSTNEAEQLRSVVSQALTDPLVRSWFDGSWSTVRRENDIIVPHGETGAGKLTARPDRVMIRDNQAVIVDYKFGLGRPSSHAGQIRAYAALLSRMGYTDIAAYIWYVSAGDIEKIL